MIESIAELRQRCQAPAYPTDSFYVKIFRRFSIYVTSLLVRTPITANQFTCVFIFTGLAADGLLIIGTPVSTLLGAAALQVWFVFDCVDGEIARYRRTGSVEGMYFDRMSHAVVRSCFFACLGIGVFRTTQHPWALASGMVAALSALLVRLASATKHSVASEVKELKMPHGYFSQAPPRSFANAATREDSRRKFVLRSLMSVLTRDPALLNLLLLAGILDVLAVSVFGSSGPVRAAEVVLGFYAGLLTYLWVKTVYTTVTQEPGHTEETSP